MDEKLNQFLRAAAVKNQADKDLDLEVEKIRRDFEKAFGKNDGKRQELLNKMIELHKERNRKNRLAAASEPQNYFDQRWTVVEVRYMGQTYKPESKK
jgi:hypothetical protein